MEKLLRRMNLGHMLPSPAGIRLKESREAHVVENLLPVQGINQVAHGLVSRAFGMLLVRQNHGRRNCDAQFGRQRVVEELVISSPPERVVDDDRSAERGILQVSAIERDVLRNAVNDD